MKLTGMGEKMRQMQSGKRVTLLLVASLTVASVILIFVWPQKAQYQILYSNPSEDDAGVITQKLEDLKIPYRVTGVGIVVHSDKVYDLRLQLASQGLPQGGAGFELFDKTSLSTTDFVQKLNNRRALHVERATTVKSLSEVEQCRVHLAFPERSLFPETEGRPKGSILFKLKQWRKIAQGQVQSIVHLVYGGVEGLNPKDVAIVDNLGQILISGSGESIEMTMGQIEYQRGLERDFESRIVGVLEPVVGKNGPGARVSVAVPLDGSYAAPQGLKERQYKARTKEDMKSVEDIVKNAIGFTAVGGDKLRVMNMASETAPQKELPEPKMEILPLVISVAMFALPVVAVIIVILLVIRPLIRSLGVLQPAQKQPLALPQTVAEMDRAMELREKWTKERVIEWAKKNPKEAAHLVKEWIEED